MNIIWARAMNFEEQGGVNEKNRSYYQALQIG